jgi:hypothetical protein
MGAFFEVSSPPSLGSAAFARAISSPQPREQNTSHTGVVMKALRAVERGASLFLLCAVKGSPDRV